MMQITLWFNYVIKYKFYKYINKIRPGGSFNEKVYRNDKG